ncbi:unnamed protein product [Lymnaea stagnalis]|uniref:SRCR domain-containing protein n=1 Tax=Lymnaea stagnalis TaxID=6523 RepID=A0AAV2HVS8_LYMST
MAGRRPCAWTSKWGLLYGAVILMCVVALSSGQQDESAESQPPAKKLEDTVFIDMLKIVDNKFDTLTTRITALERAVSNLQFFSIRQFRQISSTLTNNERHLETVNKQMDQLQVDGHGMKINLSLLGRDVTELKTNSADILGELESSVVYINDNVDKQVQYVKLFIEETMTRVSREANTNIFQLIEDLGRGPGRKESDSLNCSVDLTTVSEKVESQLSGFKEQVMSQVLELFNAATKEDEGERLEERKCQEIKSKTPATNKDVETEDSDKEITNSALQSEVTNGALQSEGNTSNKNNGETKGDYQNEMDDQVMSALHNMTTSVLQAVSYFRNTATILENLVSNTDVLISAQVDLTRKFDLIQLSGHARADDSEFEATNTIPGAVNDQPQKPSLPLTGCLVSKEVAGNVANIIRNGSQLLEVLTDLAQMASVSLTQATASLQDEVTRVEGVRTRMATTMLARATGDESDPVTRLTNTTERTFRLMEAVASNTGWLPMIFHNVNNLEAVANRSLNLVNKNYNLLMQQTTAAASKKGGHQGETEPTLSNRIPRGPGQVSGTAGKGHNLPNKDDAALDKESLETIYSASLQLKRIMPALTKLLAEPDPLIILMGGGRAEQGRVEIYHGGLWGALCHKELTHSEADVICRHIGYKGGISAGAGHFGAGAGVTWTFNASCLSKSICPVVTYSENTPPCNLERAAAVICDHMLRIVATDGSKNSKVGRLEIHHRGMWLPVCAEGWSGISSVVACKQMGYKDGREIESGEWEGGANMTWLSKVACGGNETRLDTCNNEGWVQSCPGLSPAGVRCL